MEANSTSSQNTWILDSDAANPNSQNSFLGSLDGVDTSNWNPLQHNPNFAEDIFQKIGIKREEIPKCTPTDTSTSTESMTTQEHLGSVSEADTTSISKYMHELTKEELLELQGRSTSETSKEEAKGISTMKETDDFLPEETLDVTESSEMLPESKLDSYMYNSGTEESSKEEEALLAVSNDTDRVKNDFTSNTDADEFSFKEDSLFESDIEDTSGREASLNSSAETLPEKCVSFQLDVQESSFHKGMFHCNLQESPVEQPLLQKEEVFMICTEQVISAEKDLGHPVCDSNTEVIPLKEELQFHGNTCDSSERENLPAYADTEKLPVRGDELISPEWVDTVAENKMTSSSFGGERVLDDQGESSTLLEQFQNETSQEYLDESIGYVRSLIQKNKLLKQGIREMLVYFNSGEMPEDNSSTNRNFHGSEERKNLGSKSSTSVVEDAFADSKDHDKAMLLIQLNSALRQQVKTLRDEVYHLKKANHCLSEYGEILKTHEAQNIRLKGEKRQLEQKVVHLDETLLRLEEYQATQADLILGLQNNNVALAAKIDALQLDALREEHLVETLGKLEQEINELNETNISITWEKNEIENCNRKLECALESAKRELEEKEKASRSVQMQLEKSSAVYRSLHEEHNALIQERDKFIHLSAELEGTVCQKETEIEHMKSEGGKTEAELNSLILSLRRLQEEKEEADKQLLSLTAELEQHKADREVEREQFEVKYSELVTMVDILRVESENEQRETERLKCQINLVKNENLHLQELAAQEQEHKLLMRHEADKWKQQLEEVTQGQKEKEAEAQQAMKKLTSEIAFLKETSSQKEDELKRKMNIFEKVIMDMKLVQSDLSSEGQSYEQDCVNFTCVHRASQLLYKINNLLALTEGILVCQEESSLSSEQSENLSKGRVCELKDKIKHLDSKKKILEKEERRASVSNLKELKNRKTVPEDLKPEDADTVSATMEGSKNSADQLKLKLDESQKLREEQYVLMAKTENLLEEKSKECENLLHENQTLQERLNSLDCKVKSFTEMFQMANQRLQMYILQIIRLETTNQDLRHALRKQLKGNAKQKERIKAALERQVKSETQHHQTKSQQS
nr:PREDICTED: major antigen-like isoform X2 [Latimeria chalumnae]|eukprot:XP_014349022.1 PREDICTED: major antigen-like isoform X2 [Latimeria chalumnae]